MGKYYYAVVRSSLEKLSKENGQGLPENTGERVTFYAHAQDAAAQVQNMWRGQPDTFDFPCLAAEGMRIAQPNVIGTYQVELTDEQIAKMDTTRAGSTDVLRGSIDASTVGNVSWAMTRDMMHEAKFTDEHVTVGSVPTHAAITAEAMNRGTAWERFENSLNQTYTSQLHRLHLGDPVTMRAAEESFGAHGFMQQDPASLPAEQAYCQQFMRMMTENQPLNIALKSDAFHQSFNARMDMLEHQFPKMPAHEMAVKAMEVTIDEFRQSALTTRNLLEQQVFREMQQMNAACGQVIGTVSIENTAQFATSYVNEVQSNYVNTTNFGELADRIADEVEGRSELGDSFGENWDGEFDDVGDWE